MKIWAPRISNIIWNREPDDSGYEKWKKKTTLRLCVFAAKLNLLVVENPAESFYKAYTFLHWFLRAVGRSNGRLDWLFSFLYIIDARQMGNFYQYFIFLTVLVKFDRFAPRNYNFRAKTNFFLIFGFYYFLRDIGKILAISHIRRKLHTYLRAIIQDNIYAFNIFTKHM